MIGFAIVSSLFGFGWDLLYLAQGFANRIPTADIPVSHDFSYCPSRRADDVVKSREIRHSEK